MVGTVAPDPTVATGAAADALSNGLVDGFTDNLQYIVPVIVLFTVWAILKRNFGAKRG
jgi:hypothetical protein